MLRLSCLGILLLGAVGSAALAAPVAAQSEQEDAHHRNDCRFASQILLTGNPAPHYAWALDVIRRCDKTGPSALAAVWRDPPADSVMQEQLVFASYMLRDARITDAAVGTLENAAAPRLLRLNALRVLAGHLEPAFLIGIRDLTRVDSDTVRSLFPTVDHITVRTGAVPVDAGTITDVMRVLAETRNVPDRILAGAAARTYQQLCERIRWTECSRS